MPPGGHGHRLSSPSSAKQRGSSPSLSARQTTYSPSCSKHGGSSPSSRQRASSPPSRQTSRSNPRRSSPPPMPLQPSPTPAPPIEKPAKSPNPTTPKPTPSSSKSQSAPLKVSSAPVKSVTTPPKPAHVSPKPATLSKSAYTAPKVETPFVEAKNHPVKPRTTRNSMQDVFLITALEESISGKWYNGVWNNYFVTDRVAAGMAEWLDHLTLVQRVLGSKPPSDLSQSVRRELANSLLFQAKRQKESRGVVTSIERTSVVLLD